ncbi:MAG: sigma 54-interacting transcriptional regulator [Pseudomonadota bacterium]
MNGLKRLTTEERDFFAMVYNAGIANPFGSERVALDLKIAGLFPDASRSERIEKTVYEVGRRIKGLEADRRGALHHYVESDRSLVKAAFLFEFFYTFRKRFDQIILEQMAAGDTPITVSFAGEAFSLLQRRGFLEADIPRYFALSYQLRRAFFFIFRSLIGNSTAMKRLRRSLWQNIFTHNLDFYDRYLWNRMEDFSTLILGETGTGKGTAALAIGRSGFIPFEPRTQTFVESFTRSFVSLNLSQFPETLIESELFGHKKGAFTGAVKDHRGAFARCSPYGAILLDEIGEVPEPIQIKLLEVLQERTFSPVGSHEHGRFQGRVIAATNRTLKDIREKRIFRDDFYYRLTSDIITVPPLRQRLAENPAELEDLLTHTVERMVGKPYPELVAMVRDVIDQHLGAQYPWQGNVRELEQCVRRVLLKRDYGGDRGQGDADLGDVLSAGLSGGLLDGRQLLSGYCYLLYQRHGTYEEVARRTLLDRRTVKKYITEWATRRPEAEKGKPRHD